MPKDSKSREQVALEIFAEDRFFDSFMLSLGEYGVKEVPGSTHNPRILEYFVPLGKNWVKEDETAWCAAHVGWSLEESGLNSTKALNARSYLDWGVEVAFEDMKKGDIVIFWRSKPESWKGHVARFVRYDEKAGYIWVLGGNQGNAVGINRYHKSKWLGARRAGTQQVKK